MYCSFLPGDGIKLQHINFVKLYMVDNKVKLSRIDRFVDTATISLQDEKERMKRSKVHFATGNQEAKYNAQLLKTENNMYEKLGFARYNIVKYLSKIR